MKNNIETLENELIRRGSKIIEELGFRPTLDRKGVYSFRKREFVISFYIKEKELFLTLFGRGQEKYLMSAVYREENLIGIKADVREVL